MSLKGFRRDWADGVQSRLRNVRYKQHEAAAFMVQP